MKVPYNSSLLPPAPFLPVRLSNLADDSEPLSISAKVDTGADVSAILARLIESLHLAPADEIEVEGYDGRRATLYCYDVILHVDQLRVVGLSVIAFTEDYVLLGRDVLNLLRLLLDGPALSVETLLLQAAS